MCKPLPSPNKPFFFFFSFLLLFSLTSLPWRVALKRFFLPCRQFLPAWIHRDHVQFTIKKKSEKKKNFLISTRSDSVSAAMQFKTDSLHKPLHSTTQTEEREGGELERRKR